MQAYYLHKIDAKNIYIYSPSFLSDKTFQPVRNALKFTLGSAFKDHVEDVPNMDKIREIIKNQYDAQQANDEV